jgi:hypothetical protein
MSNLISAPQNLNYKPQNLENGERTPTIDYEYVSLVGEYKLPSGGSEFGSISRVEPARFNHKFTNVIGLSGPPAQVVAQDCVRRFLREFIRNLPFTGRVWQTVMLHGFSPQWFLHSGLMTLDFRLGPSRRVITVRVENEQQSEAMKLLLDGMFGTGKIWMFMCVHATNTSNDDVVLLFEQIFASTLYFRV